MHAEDTNKLIVQIYAAAMDRELMLDMFKRLAGIVDATAGVFVLHKSDREADVALAFNHSAESVSLYNAHYHALDATCRFYANNPGFVGPSERIFAMRPDARVVEYEEDFAKKFNHYYRLAVGVNIDNTLTGVMALHRDIREGGFSELEKAENLLRLIYPHLCQAFRLGDRLQKSEAIIQALQSRRSVASQVILYGSDTDLLFADDSLAAWLDGFPVRWCNGGLRFLSLRDSEKFHTIFAAAIVRGVGPTLFAGDSFELKSCSGEECMTVDVSPGYACGFSRVATTTITLSRRPVDPLDVSVLRQRFGLTNAESAVAAALANGQNVAQYAEQKGVSVTTVRSQVRAIFDKVGVNRISDLIRRLMN